MFNMKAPIRSSLPCAPRSNAHLVKRPLQITLPLKTALPIHLAVDKVVVAPVIELFGKSTVPGAVHGRDEAVRCFGGRTHGLEQFLAVADGFEPDGIDVERWWWGRVIGCTVC